MPKKKAIVPVGKIEQRNKDRFPDDFMFQLSAEEKSEVVAN